MKKQPQVVLLGKSLFMDSIAASLIQKRFSDVIRINTEASEYNQLANSIQPDLIVYEHDPQNTNLLGSLIFQKAGALLLAIDLNSSQVLVLDCQLRPARSINELCEMIQKEVQHCPQRKEVH